LRCVRKGAVEVLAFASGMSRLTGGESEELVWRLPAN
jgi:hypothetical protein